MFDPGMPPGFGMMSSLFPILFFLIFFLVIGMIIFSIVKGAQQWSYNNKQPVLTVDASVVTKRTQVSRRSHHHHDHHHGGMHMHSSTTYFVTFEVSSGDRMELKVSGNEFGMLAEGDLGKLTFQGTRYLGFERI